MMRSMYSGVSGLRVHQTKMDVIGFKYCNRDGQIGGIVFNYFSVQFIIAGVHYKERQIKMYFSVPLQFLKKFCH